jgi:small subunit ribosomal protein S1
MPRIAQLLMSSDKPGVDEEMQTSPSAENQEQETPSPDPSQAAVSEQPEQTTAEEAPVEAEQPEQATAEETPVEPEQPEQATAEETPAEPEQPEQAAAEETPAEPEQPEEAAAEETPQDDSGIQRGQLIEGTVTETSPMSITVDLGEGLSGIIPGRELERMARQEIDDVKEGQQIMVYVVNPRDHQGATILSVNRAQEEQDWQRALEYSESGDVYEGNIAGYNKGGLIVRFGRLRGFVPQSQISDSRRSRFDGETPHDRYSDMVNDKIFVKVMEVDRSRNRLILSERAAAREVREQRKAELIEELEVGQVIEGHVVSLEDFGAFVDVGGAEGLVHLTEISWRHVTHPRDVLEVGQTVTVEVISVDQKRKRIGLSIKRQEADPWDEVATTYQVGDLVQATITKITKFGAFAQLVDAEEIEGLVHISELAEERVANPRQVVNEGEKLTLRVVKIDVKNRRLGLSLKAVNSAEYLDRDMQIFASDSDE